MLVSEAKTRQYYLDHVGDVVIMEQPAAEQLALTDSQPDPGVPRVRGPDSVSAVSASRAERVTRDVREAVDQCELQIHEVARRQQAGAGTCFQSV